MTVTLTCYNCGDTFDREYQHRARKTCSKVCQYALLRKEKVVLTDEQRFANELLRRQRSANSRRGQVVSAERRAKTSATLKRRYAAGEITVGTYVRTDEQRAQASAVTLQAYKDGRLDVTGHYKNKWHGYDGPHGRINMRSQSEVIFAEKLDAHDIDWQYEPARFDLGWTTYLPDFYLPNLDTYVEVKGWLTEKSAAKMDAFRAKGYRLVMITYNEVREATLPPEFKEVSLHGV